MTGPASEQPSLSDKTVREAVRGLIAVACLIWAGLFILAAIHRLDASITVGAVAAGSAVVGALGGIVSFRRPSAPPAAAKTTETQL